MLYQHCFRLKVAKVNSLCNSFFIALSIKFVSDNVMFSLIFRTHRAIGMLRTIHFDIDEALKYERSASDNVIITFYRNSYISKPFD